MRKEFFLPSYDIKYLETTGWQWETIVESNKQWLLIRDWPVAYKGYNVDKVDVALLISPSYPEAQIDMAYFHPPLKRSDGKAIVRQANQSIDGKDFQRWSRHRRPDDPWRSGVDEISTHLVLVDNWLKRELEK
jgi:hypothetical protein